MRLFLKGADFEAFERAIVKTLESRPMRICSHCLVSNPWHFVLWPERDGDSGVFMQKLTITHVRNWQEKVNAPQTQSELDAIQRSLLRGQPYGSQGLVTTRAEQLRLQLTLRSRGRPRKEAADSDRRRKLDLSRLIASFNCL